MLDLRKRLCYYMQAVARKDSTSTDVDEGSLKIEQKEIRRNNSYFESFCQNLLSMKYVLENSH